MALKELADTVLEALPDADVRIEQGIRTDLANVEVVGDGWGFMFAISVGVVANLHRENFIAAMRIAARESAAGRPLPDEFTAVPKETADG